MSDLNDAIADARRSHRIHEWPDVALRLADLAEAVTTSLARQRNHAQRQRDEERAAKEGNIAALNAAIRERDEARAEIERLGNVVDVAGLSRSAIEPVTEVDKMAYWARRVIDNDGALSADSSMDLDMAHDELTKAARSYLGLNSLEGRSLSERALRDAALASMQEEVTSWCERKGWKGPGSAPVTFGDTMALLHSEVSEALEAFRDWGTKDATEEIPLGGKYLGIVAKPEGVGSEFADILIRLLDDCDRWGVDLAFEFERKMRYNETRAFQHGGRTL
jgi:NTP pyrophosphatase (non-canonical NTP hydrolase)